MRWDSIDSHTIDVLVQLRDAGVLKGFYLAGGTGLAAQIGHRRSLDLDLFTDKPADRIPTNGIVEQCEKTFGMTKVQVSHSSSEQIWMNVDGVNVTYLAFPFRHLYPLINSDGIPLADVRDIAFQKAYTLGRRGKARDYIDIAWILREGILSLDDIIKGAFAVFVMDGESQFNPRLFLQQLTYTADLDDKDFAVSLLHGSENFEAIEKGLIDAVHAEAKNVLLTSPPTQRKERMSTTVD